MVELFETGWCHILVSNSVELPHRFYIPLALNLQNDTKLVETLCQTMLIHTLLEQLSGYDTPRFSS